MNERNVKAIADLLVACPGMTGRYREAAEYLAGHGLLSPASLSEGDKRRIQGFCEKAGPLVNGLLDRIATGAYEPGGELA